MDIAPVGKSPPPLSRDAIEALQHLSRQANAFFERQHHDHQKYFFILESESEAAAHVNGAAGAAYEVAAPNPAVQLLFFPAGGIPLAEKIAGFGFPRSRMHALENSGSMGTETGTAAIKETIDPVLLDPENIILIPDDVGDSYKTIFLFIIKRSLYRDPSAENARRLNTLLTRVIAAHENHNNDSETYYELARSAAAEQVVFLPVWSKNQQVNQSLYTIAFSRDRKFAEWKKIQCDVLNRYSIPSYSYDKWIIGGRITDTGVLMSKIIAAMRPEFRSNPLLTQYVGPAINGSKNEWLIRTGIISPLAYLDPTHNHEASMIRDIAHLAETIFTLAHNEVDKLS